MYVQLAVALSGSIRPVACVGWVDVARGLESCKLFRPAQDLFVVREEPGDYHKEDGS